jgi:hypothetical protein
VCGNDKHTAFGFAMKRRIVLRLIEQYTNLTQGTAWLS